VILKEFGRVHRSAFNFLYVINENWCARDAEANQQLRRGAHRELFELGNKIT